MSIQKKHSIKVLPSKKKQTISGVEIEFEINPQVKSVDLDTIYFTNFLKQDKVKYKFVKNEINRIKRNQIDTDSYEIKPDSYSQKNKARIDRIYQETYNSLNITPLIRIKNTDSQEFQIYCQQQNGKYTIQLFDLHHLIVPAADKAHGQQVADIITKYDDVKGGEIDLKDLI